LRVGTLRRNRAGRRAGGGRDDLGNRHSRGDRDGPGCACGHGHRPGLLGRGTCEGRRDTMTDRDTDRRGPLWEALGTVVDPELRRTLVDLDMIESARIDDRGTAHVKVLLTIAGCPMKNTISTDVRKAVGAVDGVQAVDVELGVMTPEQRTELRNRLRSGDGRVNPFVQPGN